MPNRSLPIRRHGVRILLIVLLLSSMFFVDLGKVNAQATSSTSDINQYLTPDVDSNVPHNEHTFIQATLIETMAAVLCQLDGVDPINPNQGCLGVDSQTHKIGYAPAATNQAGGLLGITTQGLVALYTPPASSSQYFQYLSSNFGIVRKAEAASPTGFDTLQPLIQIWLATRNLAYLFLVIAFIIIGFMIMLRMKADPRTVMTVQNQIPKIILGIILITFSYAIAGLLVDAMWIVTYFTINLFGSFKNADGKSYIGVENATDNLLTHPVVYINNVWGSGQNLGTAASQIGEAFGDTITSLINTILGLDGKSQCLTLTSFDFGACLRSTLEMLITFVFKIIVAIALLAALFRVWYALIKAYIYVLLDVATGPLWIIAGTIPGSSFGFMPWLRHLLANLSVFPATVAIFLAAFVLSDSFNTAIPPDKPPVAPFFTPPLVGNPADPSVFGWLIAFGMIMLAPELLTILRKAFKSPTTSYGSAITGGFLQGNAPLAAGAGYVLGRGWRPAGYGEAGWLRRFVAGNNPTSLRSKLIGGMRPYGHPESRPGNSGGVHQPASGGGSSH